MSDKSENHKRMKAIIYLGKSPFQLTEEFVPTNSHVHKRNIKNNSISTSKSKIKFRKILITLNHIILIFLNFSALFFESNQRKIEVKYSYITLKTNETGDISILSYNYQDNLPNEIYINNINQSEIQKKYYLNESGNNINNFTLIWNNEISNAKNMFYDCSNIVEIDLSHFNTYNITNMEYMFSLCSSLISLDLSNFNTSNVRNMKAMFFGCLSLISLELSYFDTSQVSQTDAMFKRCLSLISLNLSNFDTSQVSSMGSMFEKCSSLTSLDLSNFDLSRVTFMSWMFSDCSKLEFINFKYAKINETLPNPGTISFFYLKLVTCAENENLPIYSNYKQKIYCNNKYSYKCYTNINDNIIYNKHICNFCGEEYYIKYNDSNNNNSYINCYETYEGYYLDKNEFLYKPCYESCNICIMSGNIYNHNCIECKTEYIYEFNISNSKNCYKNYPNEIINNSVNNSYNYDIDNYNDEPLLLNETKLISFIINMLFKELNTTNLNNGDDMIMNKDNLLFILTTTANQKLNEDKNNITMNLGECENLLKSDYNISINDSLYILQIISEEEGMKIPKVEYEIYYPFNNSTNLTKLNLTSCKDAKIEISIAVKIDDILDKYNASSGYYNDICYKATTESGTDISLKDRKNEFFDNNMTLCEENCELIDYNYEKGKAKCSCDVKLSIPENYDIKFNKKDFLKSFIDIKNIANINLLKCYKTVLNIRSLKKNYGFFIIFFIVISYFITLFIFTSKSFKKLKKDIKKIISLLGGGEKNNRIKGGVGEKRIRKKSNDNKRKKRKNKYKEDKENKDKNNQFELKSKTSKRDRRKEHKKYSLQMTQNKEDKSIHMMVKNKSNKKDSNNKELVEQKDFELNGLDYEEAIKIDHRSYLQYYISLIKNNHPLMLIFSPFNDYNSRIIKIFLFLFSFSLDFTINALFFNDETMHKILEDKGKFNFLFQIPQILYSTLISKFIDTLIKILALSQDNIIDLKNEEVTNLDKKYKKKLFKTLKIKFILFFIIAFIILCFFWYYITSFCGIYINTQIHLITDSLSSLVTSFFLPFVILLIPGIFRFFALRKENSTRRLIYKFSSFLENYL